MRVPNLFWKNNRAAYFWWLLVFCYAVPNAVAQYRFDSWTAEDGLPQNIIRAIHQTRDGYLWIITLDGLARFDGVRFTIFDKNNSSGINSNRFTCFYEDSNGVLWFGTENGGVTRYAQNRFVTYTTQDGLSHNVIRGITGDDSGNVWVLSAEQIMQWDNSRFVTAKLPGLKTGFQSSEWDTGIFWAVDETGLHRFAHGQLTSRRLPNDLLRRTKYRFEEDSTGTLWMIIGEGRRVVSVPTMSDTAPSPRGTTLTNSASGYSYQNYQGSLLTINVGEELTRSITLPSSGELLKKIFFNTFYEDREGNLWMGTGGQGLYRARKQEITVYTKQQGLIENNIYPVYEDRAGEVWIGAWPGGLSRFHHGNFINYTPQDGLASKLVTALYQDRAGHLWVAAHHESNGGLRIFRDGQFASVDNRIVPERTTVAAIHQDRAGVFWFGTTRGLVRYENGVSKHYTSKDGLAGDDVSVIIEDPNGYLWIGTYGGLTRLKDDEFTSWTERDGLPSNSVRSLYFDADGALWIGTYDGGLGKFKDGRFTRYTTREGLFNNGVFQILEDGRGNLWMSSNRGIYRVSKNELNEFAEGKTKTVTSVAYGKSDGMLNTECNGGKSPAGVKTRDGKLWFPTQEGVAVIEPETISDNRKPPPVIIESLLVDREPVGFDQPVQIAPRQENFEIGYTALSFVNSNLIKFKYKLEGLDHDWVDAGQRRAAYYSHVPPGTYTFRVIAANSDGVWNTEGQSLSVVVLPPFYRTWWFVSLAALSLIAVVFFAFRRHITRLQKEHERQQAFSRGLIASQEMERKRIAAELHDSLGQNLLIIKNHAILNSIAQLDERARTGFNDISESVSQTLEEVRAIAWNLRPAHLDQLGLRTALIVMIERVEANCETKFICQIDDLDELFAPADEIIVYRIVQEGLNNIVKHARATEASVSIVRGTLQVEITIRDNGRGFDLNRETPVAENGVMPEVVAAYSVNQPAVIHHLPHGFGLNGIAERVQMLGGRHTIDSVPGQGTTVSIKLKLEAKRRGASE